MNLNFDWPGSLINSFKVFEKSAPNTQNSFSVDCILVLIGIDNNNMFLAKYIAIIIEPFLLFIIVILTSWICFLISKDHSVSKKIKMRSTLPIAVLVISFMV